MAFSTNYVVRVTWLYLTMRESLYEQVLRTVPLSIAVVSNEMTSSILVP